MTDIKFGATINQLNYARDAYGEIDIEGLHITASDIGFIGWMHNYGTIIFDGCFEKLIDVLPPWKRGKSVDIVLTIKNNKPHTKDYNPYVNSDKYIIVEMI